MKWNIYSKMSFAFVMGIYAIAATAHEVRSAEPDSVSDSPVTEMSLFKEKI